MAKNQDRAPLPPAPAETPNPSGADPLVGWFALADGVIKPSRKERKPKRSWRRAKK